MSDPAISAVPPHPTEMASPPSTPKRQVHPLAKAVARLMSPMSLQDQEAASFWCTTIFAGSLLVSFPIAYRWESLFVCIWSVLFATLVATVVCVPNWRQRPDAKLRFAKDKDVWDYYQELKRMRSDTTAAVTPGGGEGETKKDA